GVKRARESLVHPRLADPAKTKARARARCQLRSHPQEPQPATACNPHIAPAKAQNPAHNPQRAPHSCAKDPDPADQATSRPRLCDAAPATARARAHQAQTNAPVTATPAIDQNQLPPRPPPPPKAPLPPTAA